MRNCDNNGVEGELVNTIAIALEALWRRIFMRKICILLVGLCLCAVQADAKVTSIQVTIGASATQVSAILYCRWVVFQNNASHNIRIGDSTVTSSKGILLASGTPGGSFTLQPDPQPEIINLSQWYVSGTQNDVVDVTCDTINF